jgi:hypothetical protein
VGSVRFSLCACIPCLLTSNSTFRGYLRCVWCVFCVCFRVYFLGGRVCGVFFLATDTVGKPHLGSVAVQGAPPLYNYCIYIFGLRISRGLSSSNHLADSLLTLTLCLWSNTQQYPPLPRTSFLYSRLPWKSTRGRQIGT